jgi:hypothetical protein
MTDQLDPPVTSPAYLQSIVDAMVKMLEQTTSHEMREAQEIMARRLALQGDVVPSRIPAPLNITEVGGYLNLLADAPELRAQVLASVLGVAGPNPPLGFEEIGPALFFATRPNDRPATSEALRQATPVELTLRSDLLGPFEAARTELHELGCALPVLSPVRALPPAGPLAPPPPADLLPFLGRTLDLVPSAALIDPDVDPLALASLGAGALEVVARQLDAAAPRASEVTAASWTAWSCTATACTSDQQSRTYVPLKPILNAAGWFQPTPSAPTSLVAPGGWARWQNVTGLVAGMTTLGSELMLLYTSAAIPASTLRDRLDWRWDGTAFAAPPP